MATTQDLLSAIRNLQGENEERDTSKYRYVIYARKSTEGEERQARSLGDQVAVCNEIADSRKLKLLDKPMSPIEEKQSAKEPDIRPKFRKMLDDIKQGKYEGIIAWHPDRLARNMKDAGEIIDLLDKQIIKDLQFVSFTFENDTAGKMLLGMSFVLSKQYSDKLRDDVKRGIRRSIEDGKYLSKAKHGYYRDRNMMLRPDGDNFTLLKNAWQMRLQGKTQEVIAKYLVDAGYKRSEGVGNITYKTFNMTNKVLSDVFKDTFYTGVLDYGTTGAVDLTEVYDFVPMVEVDDFLKINKFSDIKKAFQIKQRGIKDAVKADFLRGIIYCGHCNEPMSAGITVKYSTNRKINYFNFRCDTIGCKITKPSGKKVNQNVRGNVILDYVYQFLEEHKFTDKRAYNHYVQEMKGIQEKERKELESRRKSLQQTAKELEDRITVIKDYIPQEEDNEIKDEYRDDFKAKKAKLKDILEEIEKVKEAKVKGSKVVLTYQKFVELFNDLPVILRKTKTMEGKDQIIRKIFSNFVLKDKKVASYQLNQPFKDFIEKGFFVSSRGGENRTPDAAPPARRVTTILHPGLLYFIIFLIFLSLPFSIYLCIHTPKHDIEMIY
ncbi:MAG: Recombinase [Candidatus Daviesbacteria bacterium GW2011_GWB1_41_5]|uniref:Recombinase n=1 Tax=Candidatus Daviesbacteria bacterium GW2011_GWB1_41_5 TaxID=1618429 RepID=A0A0G0WND5_9BACT|nr:MAG: Recombinase [Candidatus Daviesbacteria bacterium GW2011_GWB1_41_5]